MYSHHIHLHDLDDEIKIWKYLDLFKFLDLISTSTLFLRKVSLFDDKFEGKSMDAVKISAILGDEIGTVSKSLVAVNESLRNSAYISSWHINEYESSIMWDAYSNRNGGLVIESTVGRLKKSITDSKEVYISQVVYNRDIIPLHNTMLPLVHKKPEFKEEKELRVIYIENSIGIYRGEVRDINSLPPYFKININVNDLIVNSYFHPLTDDWVIESINNILNNFGFKPIKSTLYSV